MGSCNPKKNKNQKREISQKEKKNKVLQKALRSNLLRRKKQNNIIRYYETLNIDNNNIEYLSQIQALETLANLKKEFNIQRYNIHKTMANRYGYSF